MVESPLRGPRREALFGQLPSFDRMLEICKPVGRASQSVWRFDTHVCGLVKGVTDETATLRTAILAACRLVAHLLGKSLGN